MNVNKSKATVITSKFLEIKKEVQQGLSTANNNHGLHGVSSTEWKLITLENGFLKLCDLLHEVIMED